MKDGYALGVWEEEEEEQVTFGTVNETETAQPSKALRSLSLLAFTLIM